MPNLGDQLSIEIETHVREDHIHLFGFREASERQWFRILQGVQGIGARVALGILSALSSSELLDAVTAQDPIPLTRASGVGSKLAQRAVVELKDKVLANVGYGEEVKSLPENAKGGSAEDAISALTNLGYGRQEAFGAVSKMMEKLGPGANLALLLKASLKELGR